MKTVEINFGSGNIFTDVTEHVSYTGGKFPTVPDGKDVFLRTKYSGNFRFTGFVKQFFQTLIDNFGRHFVPFRVLDNGVVNFSGKINIRGVVGDISGTVANHVEIIDNYTPFDLRGDNEINILSNLPENTVNVPTAERFQIITDTFVDIFETDNNSTYFDGSNSTPWRNDDGSTTLLEYIESIVGNPGTWSLKRAVYDIDGIDAPMQTYSGSPLGLTTIKFNLTYQIAREIIDVPFIGGSSDPPAGPAWTFWGAVFTPSGLRLDRYVRPVQQTDGFVRFNEIFVPTGALDNNISFVVVNNVIYNNVDIDITGTSVIEYTRARSVIQVIKELVKNVDPSILFDETGNAPVDGIGGDSFYYFKNFTNSEGQKPLDFLQMMQLSDAIPGGNPLTEPPNKATKGMLDFNSFRKMWAERFKIDYFLEIRGSNKYFVMRHKSEQNFAVGTSDIYDTLTYKNNDWTGKIDDITYNDEDKYFSAKFEDPISNNIDFINQIIEFPKLEGIFTNQISITPNKFYFDTWFTQTNPDAFPDTDTKSWMIFACEASLSGIVLTDTLTNFSLDGVTGTQEVFTIVDTSTSGYIEMTGAALQGLSAGREFAIWTGITVTTSVPSNTIRISVVIDGISTDLIGTITDSVPVGSTVNRFTFTLPDNYNGETIRIRYIPIGGSNVDVTIFSFVQMLEYDCFKTTGKASLEAIPNGSLSIANVIEDHYLTDVPSNEVEANNKTIAIADSDLQKDREVNFVYPVFSGDEIAPNLLMNTGKGNAQLSKIVPSMDGEYSVVTAKLVQNL